MPENYNIEYKSIWRDEYLKWISGFANAEGGTIYIGIDDTGKIVGVKNAAKLLEDLPNKINSVLGIAPAIRLIDDARGQYIEIEVEPQAFPVSCQGKYHIRVGATNQLLKGTALDTFLLRKRGQSWDNSPVPNLALTDLEESVMREFVTKAREKGRIPASAEWEEPAQLVKHLRLERDGYLTTAAALLFCEEPDAYVFGCSVKIGFFEESEIIYQDEIKGPLLQQPDKVIDLLYRMYLKAKISYEGIYRRERYPFPRAAIREAIMNAIVHKNYASGVPIQIRVYDDKVIISNSCILPEGWTLERLMSVHPSEPFNPQVANAFFLEGQIESWGRGIQTIFTECRLDGINEPEYEMVGNNLMVTFTAPEERVVRTDGRVQSPTDDGASLAQVGANVASLARIGANWREYEDYLSNLPKVDKDVITCLASKESASARLLASEIDAPLRSVQRILKQLVEKHLVSVAGNGKSTRYSLKVTTVDSDNQQRE